MMMMMMMIMIDEDDCYIKVKPRSHWRLKSLIPASIIAENAFWCIYGSQNARRGNIFQLLPPDISYDAKYVIPPGLHTP